MLWCRTQHFFDSFMFKVWWCHGMEILSALLALCGGKPMVLWVFCGKFTLLRIILVAYIWAIISFTHYNGTVLNLASIIIFSCCCFITFCIGIQWIFLLWMYWEHFAVLPIRMTLLLRIQYAIWNIFDYWWCICHLFLCQRQTSYLCQLQINN